MTAMIARARLVSLALALLAGPAAPAAARRRAP